MGICGGGQDEANELKEVLPWNVFPGHANRKYGELEGRNQWTTNKLPNEHPRSILLQSFQKSTRRRKWEDRQMTGGRPGTIDILLIILFVNEAFTCIAAMPRVDKLIVPSLLCLLFPRRNEGAQIPWYLLLQPCDIIIWIIPNNGRTYWRQWCPIYWYINIISLRKINWK